MIQIWLNHTILIESLARSFAACLRAVTHPKMVMASDALLVIVPEHTDIFEQAGWSKACLYQALETLLQIPTEELVRGAANIAEGIPAEQISHVKTVPKFRAGSLHIIQAGGTAGKFSAIISGWAASGPRGSQPVTVQVGQ